MVRPTFLLMALMMLHRAMLAQPGVDDATYNAITSEVISLYGNGVIIHDVVNVDSSKRRIDVADGLIEDEHGLLTHAYVFVGVLDRSLGFTGIYRNDHVLWISGTVIRPWQGSLHIFATRDMLRDGSVEIVLNSGGWPGAWYISIIRWDGQAGTMINAVDDHDNLSAIVTVADILRFADVDGDGIAELQGEWPLDTLVTYGWNGQQYGKWPTTPQPLKTDYLPMNRFSALFSSKVNTMGELLRYKYRVQNSSSSLQSIKEVVVKHRVSPDSIVNQSGPAVWWGYASHSLYPSWENMRIQRYWDIMPGKADSSFVFSSSGLPAILPYYLLGRNAESSSEDLNLWEQNVLNNSVHGLTVAPVTPPTPFNGLSFLDTINSYINESRALGWITTDQVKNKYLRFVDTARVYLQANMRGVTKARLDSAILSVYPDSVAGLLTSEACALIRFNAEYVLNKLREEDR